MDNIQLEFTAKVNVEKVLDFLTSHDVKITQKTKGKRTDKNILFVRDVGPHKSGWMFTIYPNSGRITCSGGPSTTFFGFNAWVSLAESLQMKAIVSILRDKLNKVEGIDIAEDSLVTVSRVEITHLYQFASLEEIIQAEQAIYRNLVARYPGKVSLVGESLEVPGTLRVGLTKSTTLLRVYPELDKFKRLPTEVSVAKWQRLREHLQYCLRVETIMDKRDLVNSGLSDAAAWSSRKDVLHMVNQRMAEAGLRVAVRQDSAQLDLLLAKEATNAVKQVIEAWKTGKATKGTGTWSRAQELVKSCGYDMTIPYSAHDRLEHGFLDRFSADRVYELPMELRQDPELFRHWWEEQELVSD
jgi:hypothetical protein